MKLLIKKQKLIQLLLQTFIRLFEVMATEFILVPKARYEELINKNPTTFEHLLPQQMKHDIPLMDVSSQTGNGHFVNQTTEVKIPGILDRPQKRRKKNISWKQY
jgi:hypothetical protein